MSNLSPCFRASVTLPVTRVYLFQNGWLERLGFWRGSYQWGRRHCFRWSTQLLSLS